MKHFYISLVIFLAILTGSIGSNIYTDRTIQEFKNSVDYIYNNQNNPLTEIKKLKEEFYSKKNMLQLFINKEHIEQIEVDIIHLENSAADNDSESYGEKCIDLFYTLEFVRDNLVALD